MEARMTICNMSIEGGARAGMIAPDQVTFDVSSGPPARPPGRGLRTRPYTGPPCAPTTTPCSTPRWFRAADIEPYVTWGTDPGQGLPISGAVPVTPSASPTPPSAAPPSGPWSTWTWPRAPGCARSASTPSSWARAPTGASRTCGPPPRSPGAAQGRRGADAGGAGLGAGAPAGRGRGAGPGLQGLRGRVAQCGLLHVPGHEPGPARTGERAASTSNRNFEGRQGKGGRTHLVSPVVAAATAVRGALSTPADLPPLEGRRAAPHGAVSRRLA